MGNSDSTNKTVVLFESFPVPVGILLVEQTYLTTTQTVYFDTPCIYYQCLNTTV